MSLVRLWLFTERSGNYPEGGTYDTSVLDSTTGNCSDPEQFVEFQKLLDYAAARGEMLQRVSSADEARSLCSSQRVVTSSPPSVPSTSSSGTTGPSGGGTTAGCTNCTPPASTGGIATTGGTLPPSSTGNTPGGLASGVVGGRGPALLPAPTTLVPATTIGAATTIAGFPWWLIVLLIFFLIWRSH